MQRYPACALDNVLAECFCAYMGHFALRDVIMIAGD